MVLFASTIFLSAFLLFQIQPMIAKMILPWFGGSASVWITAMLFFQSALLFGYLYAHWSVRRLSSKTQALVHVGLLCVSIMFLPIAPSPAWKPAGNEDPILRILGLLSLSIGLPYLLLSSTSPLIQAWYARKYKASLPYRLFGLSNLASLLGLLAYPVLVEPNVTIRYQSLGWSTGFAVFALLAAASAFAGRAVDPAEPVPAAEQGPAEAETAPPKLREKIFWLVLACAASTLLLAITNHLTQNVASIPFLWVLPLSLYLLTFILVFDFERIYSRKVFLWLLLIALGAMAYGLVTWNSHTNIRLVIATYASGLFISCMFFHGELSKRKPAPRYLTSFYLMLSIGGALGGVLVGLGAPRFLPAYFELPIALIGCSALLLLILDYRKSRIALGLGWATTSAVILASGYYISAYGDSVRVMARNFYGGLRVTEYNRGTDDEIRYLIHGTVTHGTQFTAPRRQRELISYYGPESGISLAAKYLRHSPLRIGVIGLGAGSLAAYAREGDVIRFYEINPQIEELARKEFTYLASCRGKVDVVIGDGRLSLEREPSQQYDLLVADAFSGDAIPVHLLSKQAGELYFRHLKGSGILALHITNTHLDLEPVVEKLATALGKQAVIVATETDEERNIYRSKWALLSSSPITSPAIRKAGKKPAPRPGLRIWTDDYNNLFQILK
ncbi:MAG TPA: fused MFS/spermidine synthase [Nitrospirota bacterium]|nr:fused MFS/spermidine synthase [Nitrospirota bacterium]